jgi:hypothetical protein
MMVDHALALARKGLAVFPLKARSKTPWTRHGCLDATTDLETIAGWWDGWPDSNIGVATGSKSGIWVLDIDGEPGADELLKLEHRFGALPATVTAVTGTGGHHLYFRLPDFAGAPVMKNTASALAAGIDTRGEGGYVVAPPSIHPNGNPYGWGAPDEFAAAPVWLLALLDTPKVATLDTRRPAEHWSRIIQDGAGEGCRNQTAAALAGKLLRAGFMPTDTLALLLGWNARACRPPLAENEVEAVVLSIAKREAARRF